MKLSKFWYVSNYDYELSKDSFLIIGCDFYLTDYSNDTAQWCKIINSPLLMFKKRKSDNIVIEELNSEIGELNGSF